MKVLLVGDSHSFKDKIDRVFAYAARNDIDKMIILGDVGIGLRFSQFKGTGGKKECVFAHHLSKRATELGIEVLFIDGNHDNHAFLLGLEHDERGFGIVDDNVYYIPRGTKFTLDDVVFLGCGGAISVDRNKRKDNGWFWSPIESIMEDDVQKCIKAGKADVLLTHDVPIEAQVWDKHSDSRWPADAIYDSNENRKQVSRILKSCGAKLLFHGHLHWSYSEMILRNVKVTGLHYTGTPEETPTLQEITKIFDTEHYREHGWT